MIDYGQAICSGDWCKSRFGQGIGYKFYNDARQTGDTVIEILPVYWITTIGLIGFIIQVYLFVHIIKFKNFVNNYKCRFLILAQSSIFLTCTSNGYILCGSTIIILVFISYLYKYNKGKA